MTTKTWGKKTPKLGHSYWKTDGYDGKSAGRAPEYDALQVKGILNDACGGDADPQYVLLSWQVGVFGDPVQRIQVTVWRKDFGSDAISTNNHNRCVRR